MCSCFGGNGKFEEDVSNFATKPTKTAAGSDTSSFTKQVDLASFKSNVGKLDIDKLKTFPTHLNSLKSVVDKSCR